MTDKFTPNTTAYFIGKKDILAWINSTLNLNITKIEQSCTGAIYCQLLDALYPGKVKLSKVNWKATLEHEFLQNLKLLQQSLTDLGISKGIDISKLAKGRYQDNFEFLQWFKGFFDHINPNLSSYDAAKRRNHAALIYGSTQPQQNKKTTMAIKGKQSQSVQKLTNQKLNAVIEKVHIEVKEREREKENEILVSKENEMNEMDEVKDVEGELMEIERNWKLEEEMCLIREERARDKREISTLKMLLAEVGKEKEFYYSKLRDLEFLANKETSCDVEGMKKIMKEILYAENEVDVQIDNYGNVKVVKDQFN